MSSRSRAPILLLVGLVLLALSQLRWGVGALAWVAPAPLLAALRLRSDGRFFGFFAGGTLLAWSLASLKLVTAPMPAVLALVYGLVLALVHLPAFLVWRRLVRVGRDGLAIVGFAATASLLEWAQAELSPFGSWGSAPTTQVGRLPVLQLLAVVGAPGLAFVIHAAGAAVEAMGAGRLPRRWAAASAVAAVAALVWGTVRAERPIEGPEVRAAAIRTDATFAGLPLPTDEERRVVDDVLFERTTEAAAAGATLVVWPEAATVVPPADEPGFRARVSAAAAALGIELVSAYIVPLSLEPLRYENKLYWVDPSGDERLTYHKHHPVPGEPATPGAAPGPTLLPAFGTASAAICYDYDFPAVGRAHARGGAGLVAVPSSDWRGIDPVHTEMAAMRAIEGGFSIVRSTRFGLSAGIDAHGRLRGIQSTNESTAPFLLVSLPTEAVPTLYARIGNGVLLPLVALLSWAGVVAFRRAPRRVARSGAREVVREAS